MNIPTALANLTNPHDEEQLRALEQAATSQGSTPLTTDEIQAVLDLYERFPDEDGHGIFWSLLHAVEASAGYEDALFDSVSRAPGEFNVMLVGRLANAGIVQIAGRDVLALLRAVAERTNVSERARETAKGFLDAPRAP